MTIALSAACPGAAGPLAAITHALKRREIQTPYLELFPERLQQGSGEDRGVLGRCPNAAVDAARGMVQAAEQQFCCLVLDDTLPTLSSFCVNPRGKMSTLQPFLMCMLFSMQAAGKHVQESARSLACQLLAT